MAIWHADGFDVVGGWSEWGERGGGGEGEGGG